jgi:hypothetical protein
MNWGSLIPELLQIRVAAGIPNATATAMSPARIPGCHFSGATFDATTQTKIAASDPQVPGAGCIRPAPKKVATKRGHVGAGDWVTMTCGSVAPDASVFIVGSGMIP